MTVEAQPPLHTNYHGWSGTLSLVSPATVAFPVLVNGQRAALHALHIRGRLRWRTRTWEPQLWFLADSTYPLLLRWVGAHAQETNVLQTVRIDMPTEAAAIEKELTSTCRAELPGVYFGFNSTVLDAESERSLSAVASILGRHPDWTLTIEGRARNRRVELVRACAGRSPATALTPTAWPP